MLKLVKEGVAEVVRLLKARRKVWLMLLQAKRQQEMFIRRVLSLKSIR